jgi:hypothetical protein
MRPDIRLHEQAPCSSAPGDQEEQGVPRLSVVTVLPLDLWRERLRPCLSGEEAVRLRGVCRALKGLVMGWPMRLAGRGVLPCEAVLACFPAAEHLAIRFDEPLAPAEESKIVELLRRHGTLKRVDWRGGAVVRRLLLSAVGAGALPNLTYFHFSLGDPSDRQILSHGLLPLLEEVHVTIEMDRKMQVAALEPLRRLPRLRRLWLWVYCDGGQEVAFPLPPFIPPSLKSLNLDISPGRLLEPLLGELPSMLQASGAALEEVRLCPLVGDPAGYGAALARVLRACSSTLKTVGLAYHGIHVFGPPRIGELALALTSCCATLEVLHCAWAVFSAISATGPTFPRLTELRLWGEADEDIDLASPAWDIMANGRLPALTSLNITIEYQLRWEQGGGRLSRALEAVAGTLRRLTLIGSLEEDSPTGASYELGAAIGRLRRLRFFDLNLFPDGRDYHALGRGVAASGGCPELLEVTVLSLERNLDCLAYEPSLFVPSVRDLYIGGRGTEEEALLLLLRPGADGLHAPPQPRFPRLAVGS